MNRNIYKIPLESNIPFSLEGGTFDDVFLPIFTRVDKSRILVGKELSKDSMVILYNNVISNKQRLCDNTMVTLSG